MCGVGYNGPNPILEKNFHLAGIHIRESGIYAWDETLLHPKGSPEAAKLAAEGKWNRKMIGAAKVTKMNIQAEVWHDLVMELKGRDLRVVLTSVSSRRCSRIGSP